MTYELDLDGIVNKALTLAKEMLVTKPLHAEAIINQLLKAFPDHPEATGLKGILKQVTGDWEGSVETLLKAVQLDPENPDNYNNLGRSYAMLDKYDLSVENLNKALTLRPDHAMYINNLALQYRALGQIDRAIELFERAIAVKPDEPGVWCNLGGLYGDIQNLPKAIECFQRAIAINYHYAAAHVDMAFSYHLLKDWEKGFAEYEWRFDYFPQLEYYKQAYDMSKRWKGQSLEGKTILLYGEQGLGDMIQFARYAKELKQRGAAKVIVHCSDVLASIMQRIEGVDETISKDIITSKDGYNIQHMPDNPFPPYDYQSSLMSLPHTLKSFNITGEPYLKPKATLDVKKSYPDTFNIGISWAGSAAHPNDGARSVYVREFEAISKIPGVRLFNLQVNSAKRVYVEGRRVVDFNEGGENVRMVDMTNMIQTFEDSATIITGLDLVISVDTALVHLAGALGVPCWVLIPFNPDWRWGLEGELTEWYDSVRLIRQAKRNDWKGVFTRMEEEIREAVLQNQ